MNAQSLGADVIRVTGISEFRKALDVARAATGTTVIHIDTDPVAPVPSSQSWWDVPVSQVSDLESTQQAFKTYQQHKATQRPLITPSTLSPSPFSPNTEENQS
jgi:3D-(3,5/4)-trihydroxycyclohexane-1,2-dione acylhydrolase (decyclizing)